ncbi:MAG: YceI family protein [Myxococcota bacterium]|nr:YceI family protein [Myxococcota bacterium]
MNFLSRSTLVVAAVLASSAFAGEWTLDPAHSAAQFSVKHMMVSTVRGEFQKVSGTVSVDEKDVTKSKVNVTIDPASINTRQEKRDEHLRSADFFDVAQFPTMTFASTKVQKGKGGKLKVTGDLTMHGVTKPVTLDVESLSKPIKNPWGQTVRGFSATGKLNRKDFGLNWNKGLEAGGVLVGDEISLQIDGELNEAAPAPAAAGK